MKDLKEKSRSKFFQKKKGDNMTLFEKIKLKIKSLSAKENQLISELKQIQKLKIVLAMILVSEDYVKQVLKGEKDE